MSREISKWCAGALVGLLIGSIGAEMWARDRIHDAHVVARVNQQDAWKWQQFRSLGLDRYCEVTSERAKGGER